MAARDSALRSLPGVDQLLRSRDAGALLARYPRPLVADALRDALAAARRDLGDAGAPAPAAAALLADAAARLAALAAPSLRPAINATGVVLHTNLGRAPLADAAVAALTAVATRPCTLEIDLADGGRGERDAHVEAHLRALTGAEAALAVNNNAAAVLLALNTLAEGREVVASRGELVEIGGAFRIPDVCGKSLATLREVGTTNRTHAADYERAINECTAVLLKVHPSNYRIAGFTAAVELEALAAIGRARGVPVVEDLGSGALVDLTPWGLPAEPVVGDRLRRGADLVTFSGDKLLGGPQAGLVVGRADLIARLRRNPLRRALRCDKLTLAALEATLRLYRTAPDLAAALPALSLLTRPLAALQTMGEIALALLARALGPDYRMSLEDAAAAIGSGAQPTETLPSKAIAIRHPTESPRAIAARFRASEPPIIGRVHDDRFWLDLRCVAQATDLLPRRRGQGAGE
ncbi:L-seryl-tRNA(Sec) selenium transferase [bacterium]|nr:L-seryl-tRNA(Sec) selenium transferase [bacterium]